MTQSTTRIDSLDLLRGLAILAMILSGVVPHGILPAWMYHAQVGPPDHVFNPELPGLTWVDLVFPFFIFCMGAAFPLALTTRLKRAANKGRLLGRIRLRAAALAVFAIMLQHMRPHHLENPPSGITWLLAILGLFILFLAYSRYPLTFLKENEKWMRRVGWALLLLWIPLYHFYSANEFSLGRSDIILMVLANMVLFGGFIWVLTYERPHIRFVILAIYLAFRLAHNSSPWMQSMWSYSPAPWIFRWDYLKYLLILIPGMISGELLQKLSAQKSSIISNNHRWVLSLGSLAIILVALCGYQARWLLGTSVLLLLLVVLNLYIAHKMNHEMSTLLFWGALWLSLGVLLEPFEGGIKKDPSTLSYYFLTAGLATFTLATLQTWSASLKHSFSLKLLIDNGRNPMLAYVLMANLIWPLLTLTGMETFLSRFHGQVLAGLSIAIIKTFVLALWVQWFTKKGWVWKT